MIMETLTRNRHADATREVSPDDAVRLLERRQRYLRALVDAGELSEEFAASGAANKFGLDINVKHNTAFDALSHILFGEKLGGFHHSRSVAAIDMPGRTVASSIYHPNDINHSRASQYTTLSRRQQLQPNGTYRALDVTIQDPGDPVPHIKAKATTVFPDAWSTEQVMRAIIAVAEGGPGDFNGRSATDIHRGIVDGVEIRVETRPEDGMIVGAYPIVPDPTNP